MTSPSETPNTAPLMPTSRVERRRDCPPTTRGPLAVVTSMTGTAAAAALVAAVVNIVMARGLGPDARGNVAFLLQVAYFAAPLAILAADRVLLRRRDLADFPSVVPPRVWTLATAATLSVILGVALSSAHVIVGLIVVTVAWFNVRRAQAITAGTLGSYARPFMCWQLLILLGSCALWAMGITSWPLWALVYGLPALLVVVRPLALPTSTVSRVGLRNSAALTLGALTQSFSLRGERVLLPLMTSPAELGLYAVVATATEPLYWAGQALADHRTSVAKARPNARGVTRLVMKDLALFVPVAAAVGVALHLLIVLIFGNAFTNAVHLVLPLAIASVALVLYRQCAGLLLAHAPHRVGWSEGMTAVVALGLYTFAIHGWGAMGAAWASAATYSTGFVIATVALVTAPVSQGSRS